MILISIRIFLIDKQKGDASVKGRQPFNEKFEGLVPIQHANPHIFRLHPEVPTAPSKHSMAP